MPVRTLTRDGYLLFATRIGRMVGYGVLAVVLVLYLAAVGLDGVQIGLILTFALAGDAVISLVLTSRADRAGRRRVLVVGALLMALAGIAFAVTGEYWLLVAAATVGVISPGGTEVGPFLAVEQAALTQTLSNERRTPVLAWYALVGSLAAAAGALLAGVLVTTLEAGGLTRLDAYRGVLVAYAGIGLLLAVIFSALSSSIEIRHAADPPIARRIGLHRSAGVVARLAALFGLDAFAGGFVVQSVIAYWFAVRFGAEPALLGALLFGANALAGLSALLAAWLAARIGLVRTMVFTHLPSNVLLILVPLMPTLPAAALVLLARFSISQMDVPARQSYVLAVVAADERSAAAGVTGVARSVGAAISPSLAAPLIAVPGLAALPFIVAGGLKIAYDLLLYREFAGHRPPEESGPAEPIG